MDKREVRIKTIEEVGYKTLQRLLTGDYEFLTSTTLHISSINKKDTWVAVFRFSISFLYRLSSMRKLFSDLSRFTNISLDGIGSIKGVLDAGELPEIWGDVKEAVEESSGWFACGQLSKVCPLVCIPFWGSAKEGRRPSVSFGCSWGEYKSAKLKIPSLVKSKFRDASSGPSKWIGSHGVWEDNTSVDWDVLDAPGEFSTDWYETEGSLLPFSVGVLRRLCFSGGWWSCFGWTNRACRSSASLINKRGKNCGSTCDQRFEDTWNN